MLGKVSKSPINIECNLDLSRYRHSILAGLLFRLEPLASLLELNPAEIEGISGANSC